MGLVIVEGEIGPGQGRTAVVEFMVDTGSLYTVVGPELGAQLGLGLEFPIANTLVMADGTSVNAPLGLAFLRIGDREGGTLVAEMQCIKPLLGAIAMQALGLKVNPKDEVLEFDGRYPPPV